MVDIRLSLVLDENISGTHGVFYCLKRANEPVDVDNRVQRGPLPNGFG